MLSRQNSNLSKQRTRPNINVSVQMYTEALHQVLMLSSPVIDLKMKLGPNFACHVKQVTPGALMVCLPLFNDLIAKGCQNLVLQRCKMVQALSQVVNDNELLKPRDTMPLTLPSLIHEASLHILMCAAMMQDILSDPWVEGDGCKTMSADDMARCGCLATCTPGTVCDGGTGWAALTSETNSSVTVDIEGAIESLLQGRRKIDHPESYCPHFPVETVENEVTSPNAFRDRCCQPNGIENGIKMIQVGLYGRERGERVFRTLQPLFLSIVTATIPFLVKKISMFEQR